MSPSQSFQTLIREKMQLDVEVSPPAFVRAQLEVQCNSGVHADLMRIMPVGLISMYDFLSSDFFLI